MHSYKRVRSSKLWILHSIRTSRDSQERLHTDDKTQLKNPAGINHINGHILYGRKTAENFNISAFSRVHLFHPQSIMARERVCDITRQVVIIRDFIEIISASVQVNNGFFNIGDEVTDFIYVGDSLEKSI